MSSLLSEYGCNEATTPQQQNEYTNHHIYCLVFYKQNLTIIVFFAGDEIGAASAFAICCNDCF